MIVIVSASWVLTDIIWVFIKMDWILICNERFEFGVWSRLMIGFGFGEVGILDLE